MKFDLGGTKKTRGGIAKQIEVHGHILSSVTLGMSRLLLYTQNEVEDVGMKFLGKETRNVHEVESSTDAFPSLFFPMPARMWQ